MEVVEVFLLREGCGGAVEAFAAVEDPVAWELPTPSTGIAEAAPDTIAPSLWSTAAPWSFRICFFCRIRFDPAERNVAI